MEVCGGHTHTIFRYGIQQMLPDAVEFVHGPGCPVCVLPMGRVDDCVALAERPEVIFTTFGDAMRVPGSRKSLLKAKADGADVRMVYSPLDALADRPQNPDREVIFFGLGFETTMPSTAMTLIQARAHGIGNFSLFCNHITIIPTIKAILDSPGSADRRISWAGSCQHGDRHSALSRSSRGHYRKPITVAGFEPLDVLQSTWMVLKQLAEGRCEVENQYGRVVPEDGNARALAAIAEVFELREFFEWRGLGSIDHSGVRVRAGLRGVRRRAQVRRAERQHCRPAVLPVRRGAEGRHQAAPVQGLRQRLHAGNAARLADGVHAKAPAPPNTTTATVGRSAARRRSPHERAGAGSPRQPVAWQRRPAMRALIEDVFLSDFANTAAGSARGPGASCR